MKKIIVVLIALVGLNVIPSYANQPVVDQSQIEKTNRSHALIGLPEAHKMGYTGKGQVIVIIDDGFLLSSPAFKDRVIDGYCSSREKCGEYYKKSGVAAGAAVKEPSGRTLEHGTLVGSIAAGNKLPGIFPGGIAPDAKLISINNNSGHHEGILLALDWILSIKDKYNIAAVNGSFGLGSLGDRNNPNYCPNITDISQRLKKLRDNNIPFIAAAGNNGGFTKIMFPACNEHAIAVGATNESGSIESYSDISKEISVIAPATVLGASANSDGYWIGGGTSSAAPVVAGAVAILKQVKPNATFDEIKKSLMTSSNYVDDLIYSQLPILDIPSSIKALQTNSYSNKVVEKKSTTNSTLSNSQELNSLKSEIATLKLELSITKIENVKSKNVVEDLINQIEDTNKINSTLVNKQDALMKELELVKKQNSDILKKVKVICSSKSRSALCKSLGL